MAFNYILKYGKFFRRNIVVFKCSNDELWNKQTNEKLYFTLAQ